MHELDELMGFIFAGGDDNIGQPDDNGGSSTTPASTDGTGTDTPAGGQSQDQNAQQQARPEDFYNGKRLDEHPRFRQVNQRLREYADLGLTPSQIRELQSRSAGNQQRDAKAVEADRIRKELREIEPGLVELDRQKQEAEELRQATYDESVEKIDGYLKDLGLDATEQNNLTLQDFIAGVLRNNKRLAYRFAKGDLSAIDEAFDHFKKNFYEPMKRQSAATLQKSRNDQNRRLPITPKGGSPTATAPKQPQTLKEASEVAWDRFQQTE